MNRFSWLEAFTIEEATEKVNATVSETIQPGFLKEGAVLKAGGIDLLDLMKEGLSKPTALVSTAKIPGLEKIEVHQDKSLTLFANVTLAAIASDQTIREHYTALHQAVSVAATPQIRNMATLAGNLAQRTRCWYFRSKYHECFRKGSITCFAQIGENRYHSILNNSECASVHSSSLATALLALNAAIEITNADGKKKVVNIGDFFVTPEVDRTRENILEAGEMITAVHLPAPGPQTRSHYEKMGELKSHDWPVADVAVVAEMENQTCKKVWIALGAAAPVPVRSVGAEKILTGKEVTPQLAKLAGTEAMKNATPLSQNYYKIQIFETLIKRAIETVLC